MTDTLNINEISEKYKGSEKIHSLAGSFRKKYSRIQIVFYFIFLINH